MSNPIALRAGPHELWIPAAATRPHTSSGCGPLEDLLMSSGRYVAGMPFDGAAIESSSITIAFPKRWDEGTITFKPYWLNTAGGSGAVVWQVSGVAMSDDDTLDVATGTAQTSTDTVLAAKKLAIGPLSSAITISGSPAAGDLVRLLIQRDPTAGGDTYTSDAYLIGVKLWLSVDSSDDT